MNDIFYNVRIYIMNFAIARRRLGRRRVCSYNILISPRLGCFIALGAHYSLPMLNTHMVRMYELVSRPR